MSGLGANELAFDLRPAFDGDIVVIHIGMHMRNYVPDRSIDWTGGVGVPEVELHLADAGAPTLIRQDEKSPALYVLMPMRV